MEEKKVAVVTGAGSGIGLATMELLDKAGYTPYGIDITYPHEPRFTCFECHVGHDESSVARIFDYLVSLNNNRIDVLVNCAGRHLAKPIEDTPTLEFNKILDTNMRGLFFCIRAALPYLMLTQGTIVNVASGVAMAPDSTAPLYSASKAWIVNLTQSLYLRYQETGVRAHVVLPGPTDTPFLWKACGGVKRVVNQCGSNIPLNQLIEPEEIAEIIAFIVSDAGRCLGPVIDASGGETINFRTESR